MVAYTMRRPSRKSEPGKKQDDSERSYWNSYARKRETENKGETLSWVTRNPHTAGGDTSSSESGLRSTSSNRVV